MIRLSPLSLNWLENIARQHISLMKLFFWKYLLQQRRNLFILTAPAEKGVLIGIGPVSLAKVNNIFTNIVIAWHIGQRQNLKKNNKENVNNTIIVTIVNRT